MFHFSKIHASAAGLWLAVAAACAVFGGPSAPASTSARASAPSDVASTPAAPPNQPECRAQIQAIDVEIQRLRQSCELELEAFAACRAARPEWDSVELFSCGFEMSTSLARGDLEDPASLKDCGTSAPAAAPSAEGRALPRESIECPVPACEADLEALEALRAGRLSATEPAC